MTYSWFQLAVLCPRRKENNSPARLLIGNFLEAGIFPTLAGSTDYHLDGSGAHAHQLARSDEPTPNRSLIGSMVRDLVVQRYLNAIGVEELPDST